MNAVFPAPVPAMSTAEVPGGGGAPPLHRAEESLSEPARLRWIWERSDELLCVADRHAGRLELNPAGELALGPDGASWTCRRWLDHVHSLDRRRALRAMSALSRGRSVERLSLRMVRSGRDPLQVTWRAWVDQEKDAIQAIGRVEGLPHESGELRRSEERWSRSIELAAYPVILWNTERTITYANKAALELLQWRRHELLGRSLDELLGDSDLDHRQALARMRQDGWSHRITNLRGAGGQHVPVELKAVDLGDGTFQAMLFDMREWVAIEERLKTASQRDNLTGLLSRRAIEEHADVEIHRARRRASSVTLLLIDIDRFKEINDQHGHLIGDAVLQRVAELISSAVRITDWVGRWGGDEILVVLGETREEEALRIAERIRSGVAGSPLETMSRGRIPLTVSVGVASGSVGFVPSLQQFFERVDRALYLAKRLGRNRVICYQDTTAFRRFPALEGGQLG